MVAGSEVRQSRGGHIGISFSGGGFRATAFSLGTLTLLQDLGLLANVKVMSSVSGGSLALAAYLCAKAGSDAEKESDFRFDDCFYQPLMRFLEGERLAEACLNLVDLFSGEKLILKAADATHVFLNELLNGGDDFSDETAYLGNEKITEMLTNDDLSPDFIFFNATNITSLDLFRFGIERGIGRMENGRPPRPVFVLNRYFLKHSRDSAEGKNLYHYAQKLRLADCVAASFGFPAGFEPLLFPDDFFRPSSPRAGKSSVDPGQWGRWGGLEEAKKFFRGDLICDYKQYLAFLDGGLYDNLGLASVEDIRQFLSRATGVLPSNPRKIHYVIATDVDQIPMQLSAYSDPEVDRLLDKPSCQPSAPAAGTAWSRFMRGLQLKLGRHPILLPIALAVLLALLLFFLDKTPASLPLADPFMIGGDAHANAGDLAVGQLFWVALKLVLWGLLGSLGLVSFALLALWLWLGYRMGRQHKTPSILLGLSRGFDAKQALLESWWQVAVGALIDLVGNRQPLWQAISSRRMGQLMPAFSGYLKRTRSLTYGYLQQMYKRAEDGADCHLIRNMIFELTPGRDVDPDYASNLITLPISDYRHEEKLEPISPITQKISRARYVSAVLQGLQALEDRPERPTGTLRVSVRDFKAGPGGQWTRLDMESEIAPPRPEGSPASEQPLLLRLLTTEHGRVLPEAGQIIDELNLQQADQIWRWLCNNLACFDDAGEGDCLPAHPYPLSIPTATLVAEIHRLFKRHLRQDEQLLERCLVSLEESTSSYSWIPLLCEMATNVPTTLWLKGACWYTPNQYDSRNRISRGGHWSATKPDDPDARAIDLGALGPAPAAAICSVAGYVSTCFNLLEFFYAWLGDSSLLQEKLLEQLKLDPFPFITHEKLQELEALPYRLRHRVWWRLDQERQRGTLPPSLLRDLALLEG
ncbi:MAG: patatin-like phospholipase family protein, partial [Cyanobacteriota bacterium]|nr:patatin-like phospholipase family protein [Cyanobacteriota bacterium]